MKTIILAGGKATRLPESVKNIPGALVDVGGKPIIRHQHPPRGKSHGRVSHARRTKLWYNKKSKSRVINFLEKPFGSAQGKPGETMPGYINAGFYTLMAHPDSVKKATSERRSPFRISTSIMNYHAQNYSVF